MNAFDTGSMLQMAVAPGALTDAEPALKDFRWYHSIDLGNGEVTKGAKSAELLGSEADVIFKHGVAGKSVLDIGAWDGFFSFEAEKRGASRVLATDSFCWGGPGWGKKIGFDYARLRRGSQVESEVVDVFEFDPERQGKFDTVLFLGVLYHLREPFSGLMKAAAMTKETLVVETHVDLLSVDVPAMRFYVGTDLNRDDTNFFGPNPACLIGMLKEIGFSKIELTSHPLSPNLLQRYGSRFKRLPVPWRQPLSRTGGRVIAHASW